MNHSSKCFLLGLLILSPSIIRAQLATSEFAQLPVRVANNAVCEGYADDEPYLFSFGGIDSTKEFSGIHKKCFRVNLVDGKVERIPDLPDERGKIASAASRVGDVIYISGGYYVFQNQTETSSDKMHRYSVNDNRFLADGKPIPQATDDHVQGVWRDSLIYLITGWKDSRNIPNVQIYNPNTDEWSAGSPVPNNPRFTAFGASGVIIADTIFYFGGAASISGFPIRSQVRKGVIDPKDPTKIEWTEITTNENKVGYRMAATSVNRLPYWIGGSEKTYNFDGLAYGNGQGVEPSNRSLGLGSNGHWLQDQVDFLPMDLRGIASISDDEKYVAGGMAQNQEVSNMVYKLSWLPGSVYMNTNSAGFSAFPNPFNELLTIRSDKKAEFAELLDSHGKRLETSYLREGTCQFETNSLSPGIYIVKVFSNQASEVIRIVKQ